MKYFSFLKTKKGIFSLIISGLFIWFLVCLPEPLFKTPTSTVLEDSEGKLLSARIATDGQWRFPLNTAVPPKFATCIIQFEDKQFFHHR
ncbi:MAG: penicillin-binding protein 1C, partial [Bacteroidia bacterium]|nr:penicillin-binding protein 1C [Bacteroidia bacterium]